MPYARPTLTQLIKQAQQDLNDGLSEGDGFLRRGILKALAYVQAVFAWGHYGYIDYLAKNFVPWTATGEYAQGWGGLKGVYQKAATLSTGPLTSSGNQPGVSLRAGASLVRSDSLVFTTAVTATSDESGNLGVTVVCSTAGSIGATDVGTSFTLSNPVEGLIADFTASAIFTNANDQETDEAYVARYLLVYQSPPQGGDRQDFINWALAIPGVTRAWVWPTGFGAGTVIVYTMFDEANSETGGFPNGVGGVATNENRDTVHVATQDLLTVANSIFLVQPVPALVYSEPPIAEPINFAIANVSPNNSDIVVGMEQALTNMFVSLGNVGGTVNPVDGSPWPPIYANSWESALLSVPGLKTFSVTSPVGSISPGNGQLLTLGTVTVTS